MRNQNSCYNSDFSNQQLYSNKIKETEYTPYSYEKRHGAKILGCSHSTVLPVPLLLGLFVF